MTIPIDSLNTPAEPSVLGGFVADEYDWEKHLKIALAALPDKQRRINRFWDYYNGDQPRVWLNDTFREMFKSVTDEFIENWCEPVVNKPLDRLEVTGWVPITEGTDNLEDKELKNTIDPDKMVQILKDNDLEIGQSDLYRQMRVAGEAFLIVWPSENPKKKSGFDVTVNDARWVYWPNDKHRSDPEYCVLIFVEDHPETKVPHWNATVYYSEVVVRLIGPKITPGVTPSSVRYFTPNPIDPGGPHGFDKVPVIRFSPEKEAKSSLKVVIPLQDQVNKLKANKMVVAEWLAFPLIAVMTEQTISDGDLKSRPNRMLHLHPGGGEDGAAPTSIWQSTPADLANFDNSIEKEIQKIFTLTGLPRHILVDNNAPISGDGIEADEGPFTELLKDLHRSLGGSWSDLAELCGLNVEPQWRSVDVRSDKSESETVSTFVAAGVKLPEALTKYAGWTQQEVDDMVQRDPTIDEAANVIRTVGNSVALGADPEHARVVTGKLTGHEPTNVSQAPIEKETA